MAFGMGEGGNWFFFLRALAQALVDPKSVILERVDQERAEYREPPGSPDP